jgi:hypothetical protein
VARLDLEQDPAAGGWPISCASAGSRANSHPSHPILAAELDRSLSGLNDAFGGCERITYTPLPFTYSVILLETLGDRDLPQPLKPVDFLLS